MLKSAFAISALLLAACSGGSAGQTLPNARAGIQPAHRQTFSYTGKAQSFTVPDNVTQITIDALGARGGGPLGGLGGRVHATIPVASGEVLTIEVGGEGSGANGSYGTGFNGGAAGGGVGSYLGGYGGGGASDVREGGTKLDDRVLVAGGGGGEGGNGQNGYNGGAGGSGGAGIGGAGAAGGSYSGGGGGGGGTQHHGGHGGYRGKNGLYGERGRRGSRGNGGAGGAGAGYHSGSAGGGGGGAGGYYGGGGGGGGGSDSFVGGSGGGGGGGSSYVEPTAISRHEWRGWKNASGNGAIVVTWR